MTKLISVTQEDIRIGNGRALFCPVGRALVRTCPSGQWAVDYKTLDLHKRVKTPRKVADFISRHDTGKPVKPFTFRLGLP